MRWGQSLLQTNLTSEQLSKIDFVLLQKPRIIMNVDYLQTQTNSWAISRIWMLSQSSKQHFWLRLTSRAMLISESGWSNLDSNLKKLQVLEELELFLETNWFLYHLRKLFKLRWREGGWSWEDERLKNKNEKRSKRKEMKKEGKGKEKIWNKTRIEKGNKRER